jgi:hypothetical protein
MITTHATSQKVKKNIAENRSRGSKGHLIKYLWLFRMTLLTFMRVPYLIMDQTWSSWDPTPEK